jgi:hypothetical protein
MGHRDLVRLRPDILRDQTLAALVHERKKLCARAMGEQTPIRFNSFPGS